MSLISGFDATQVPPSAGFDLIPEGTYVAEIIKSEEKETQDGTGKYVALTWQISEGPFEKRRVWVNLNLQNRKEEAVKIARAELSAICHAIEVVKPQNAEQMLYRRCRIKIAHRKNKQSGAMEARISKYEPLNAAPQVPGMPAPSAPNGTPPAGAATGGTATPPWARKV